MSTPGSAPPPVHRPLPMEGVVRDYDWGSTTTIARLQGRTPTGGPEAELWLGAHAAGPSSVVTPDGVRHRLDELVAAAPGALLGRDVAARFDDRLPFLLKVLAIARPLSLQVHPGAERAREAHAGEGFGEHRYTDPYPKPELLYALEPVDALCGFRPAAQAARLLGLLDGPRAAAVAAPLLLRDAGSDGDGTACLEEAFEVLVTWPDDDRPAFAADMAREARRLLAGAGPLGTGALPAEDRRALTWVSRLASHHPKDPLVVAPLLLDLVLLRPGGTLFVPAGAPHAYLHGTGVEVMASSDNVLRAGLTSKPVAVEELLHVVDGRSRPQQDLPALTLGPGEVAWRPPVPWFQLTRLRPAAGAPVAAADVAGPQVLLCSAGAVTVSCAGGAGMELRAGSSAFIAAGAGPLHVAGAGELFRAAVGG